MPLQPDEDDRIPMPLTRARFVFALTWAAAVAVPLPVIADEAIPHDQSKVAAEKADPWSLQVPGNVFFRTSPLTPEEMMTSSGNVPFVIVKLQVDESAKSFDRDKFDNISTVKISIIKVLGLSDIQNGRYTAKVVTHLRPGRGSSSFPDETVRFQDVYYSLATKGPDGSISLLQRELRGKSWGGGRF